MAIESEEIYIYIRSDEVGFPLLYAGAVRTGGTVRFLNETLENAALSFAQGTPFIDSSENSVVPAAGTLVQTVKNDLTGIQNFHLAFEGRHLLLVVAEGEEGSVTQVAAGPVNVIEKIDFIFEPAESYGLGVFPAVGPETTALHLVLTNLTPESQSVILPDLSSRELEPGGSTSVELPLDGPYPRNYRLTLGNTTSLDSKFPNLEAGGTDYVVIIVDP